VYALSLLVALLTVGSLSDHLGRKPVIFTAVLLEHCGDAAVYPGRQRGWLISARVLQGFATGMATAVLVPRCWIPTASRAADQQRRTLARHGAGWHGRPAGGIRAVSTT
jgi:MFS family permease